MLSKVFEFPQAYITFNQKQCVCFKNKQGLAHLFCLARVGWAAKERVLLPECASCLGVPILWQSPQPELLTRMRQRSKSLWRPPSNELCRTPCPILATPHVGCLDFILIDVQPPLILQIRTTSSQEPCVWLNRLPNLSEPQLPRMRPADQNEDPNYTHFPESL